MLRFAFALAMAGGLAACQSDSPGEQGSYAGYAAQGYGSGVDPRSLANPVMPRAFAALPAAAGPIVNVLEQRFVNGLTQEIVLAGDVPTGGENKITVSMLSRQADSGDGADPGMLRLQKGNDQSIAQELSDQFPDVGMNFSQILDRNAQGPFGYAVGHRGRITCIYAWQWLEDRSGGKGLFADLSAADSPSATVRVRLCKTGMSEQALAGLVRQLIVSQNGFGGAYGGGGASYYPAQGAYGGGDALTMAGHAGPVAQTGYRRQAATHGNGQPGALYNTPANYQGVSAQPDSSYQVHRAAHRRHVQRARYRHNYHAPAELPLYDGQTAGVPLPGPVVYAPAPTAQVPRYVPVSRAPGVAGAVYNPVPLPE